MEIIAKCLRIETSSCTLHVLQARQRHFLKLLHRLHIILKKMQAFTRFDLLKSKQFQLIKSHKTSALKTQRKNSSSRRPKKSGSMTVRLGNGQAWNLSVLASRSSEGQGEHLLGNRCALCGAIKRSGENVPLPKLIQGPWSIKTMLDLCLLV